jgi:hypothetical protein
VSNEIKQVIQDPLDYLFSFWNWIDLLGPIGVYTLFIMNLTNTDV